MVACVYICVCYCRYSEAHVQCLASLCVYSADVPEFLHNRPRRFVEWTSLCRKSSMIQSTQTLYGQKTGSTISTCPVPYLRASAWTGRRTSCRVSIC